MLKGCFYFCRKKCGFYIRAVILLLILNIFIMSSTAETGYAANLANFESLISFCKAYDTQYNPANDWLTLVGLQTL
jgi:hypothetical protein